MAIGIENNLWTEKYRPTSLQDLVLEPGRVEKFQEMLSVGEVPHLMLLGTPGSGKTTLAKILIAGLDCDVLVLNSSADRGIDIVRDRVKSFVTLRSNKRWRIVLLEEADNLTTDAQQAMRNLMEEYSLRARFIMTGNYRNRLIDPIKSRCQVFEFSALPQKECAKRLRFILDAENIKYDVDSVLTVVSMYYPDMRKIINATQLSVVAGELKEIRDDISERNNLLTLIKTKNIDAIRSMAYRIDAGDAYLYIFDHMDQIVSDPISQVQARLWVGEWNKTHTFSADKEVHFCAFCLGLMSGAYGR